MEGASAPTEQGEKARLGSRRSSLGVFKLLVNLNNHNWV